MSVAIQGQNRRYKNVQNIIKSILEIIPNEVYFHVNSQTYFTTGLHDRSRNTVSGRSYPKEHHLSSFGFGEPDFGITMGMKPL